MSAASQHNNTKGVQFREVFSFHGCPHRGASLLPNLKRSNNDPPAVQDQYMFIHDAVLEQLMCGDTQIQATDLNRTLPRLLQPQQQRDGSFKTTLALQFDVSCLVSENLCQHQVLPILYHSPSHFTLPDTYY